MNYFKLFNFIKNNNLQKTLILDYKEILTALKRQAPKSAVVLSGGIVEAILKDLAMSTKNRSRVETKYREISGKRKKVENLDLYYLIKIMESLQLISNVDASAANILRDYRNMIHPFKYPKRPKKRDANLTKQLLDNLLNDRKSKIQIKKDDEKGKLFFTHDYYKTKRSKKEYKEIIKLLYKKKVVSFQEVKSLSAIKNKKYPGKSAAPLLSYLKSLGICSYDKKSWRGAPIKRYEKWIFNKKFNSLVKEYLK